MCGCSVPTKGEMTGSSHPLPCRVSKHLTASTQPWFCAGGTNIFKPFPCYSTKFPLTSDHLETFLVDAHKEFIQFFVLRIAGKGSESREGTDNWSLQIPFHVSSECVEGCGAVGQSEQGGVSCCLMSEVCLSL